MFRLTVFHPRGLMPSLRALVTAFVIVLMCVLVARARGADDPGRDRKARAALAVAETVPGDRDRSARAAMALAEGDRSPAARAKGAACPCGPGCVCDGRAKSDLAKVRDSLVRVNCGDTYGSGTVVWSEGDRSVILTAAHLITPGASVTVRGGGKTHAAQVLATDKSLDLAALLVLVELPATKVSATDPEKGADVLMVGLTSLWSRGKVEAFDRHTYLLGYESDHGDSGGGVFLSGELVGVHCGKCGETEETCTTPYCTGAKPIRTFLAKILRREGPKAVPVEAPRPAAPVPSASRGLPPRLTISGVPHELRSDGSYHPLVSGCPNGRCPLQK